DTFEERFNFKLSRLNVFVSIVIGSLTLIFLTTLLIAFTALREYIPGYSSTALKRQAQELSLKVDSLEQAASANELFFSSIKNALTGNIIPQYLDRDSIMATAERQIDSMKFKISESELKLRAEVEREEKYNVNIGAMTSSVYVLTAPVTGRVTQTYNAQEKHYGVDIATEKSASVKAVADGVVIFSGWTIDTGNVILIYHNNGLISAYMHNESVDKTAGDLVRAGEVIATAGNSGELSTGPHLHFELWSNGYPIDPMNYIDFN
ncbi:MAG: M23 family metallopeptidase, partial [Flavobacteriaceae bacterium]|nr:M23 family metallopeptidase [Flavobacteriaceae bacterium]